MLCAAIARGGEDLRYSRDVSCLKFSSLVEKQAVRNSQVSEKASCSKFSSVVDKLCIREK